MAIGIREDNLFERYCRTGNPAALAAVFDHTAAELWRVARHLTSDPHAADDLVQETFLVVIENRDRFDPQRALLPWMLGILANLARRRSRHQRTSPLPEATADPSPAADPVARANHAEWAHLLDREIQGLPHPYSEALHLHLQSGLTAQAIATQRGCPPSTVRNQIMRGMDLLRRSLPAVGALGIAMAISPERLAAMRAAVVGSISHPTTHAPVAAQALMTGLSTMKQALIVLAGTAAIGITTLLWLVPEDRAPLTSPTAEPENHASMAAAATAHAEPTQPTRRIETTPPVSKSAETTLLVKVVFSADQTPAADVGIYLRNTETNTMGRELRTDASGQAVFENLAKGRFLIQPDRSPGRTVGVAAGQTTEIELLIPAGARVRGTVVDLEKQRVPNTRIYATRLGHHDYRQLVAMTDHAGNFDLRDVAPDTILVAWAPGYQPSHPRQGKANAGPNEIQTMVLKLGARGHSLSGTVVDPDGSPVAHALVAIAADEDSRKHPEGELGQKYPSEFERPMDLESFLIRCDERGSFETSEVPMGKTLIIAREPADDGRRIAFAQVLVRPNTNNQITLQLDLGAEVHGRILDEQGRGYADLPVLCEWRGTIELGNLEHHTGHLVSDGTATTDGDGRFVLTGLLPGPQEICVGAFFDEHLHIDDHTAIHDERFELDPGHRLQWQATLKRRISAQVDVVGPDSQPLVGWTVFASPSRTTGSRQSRSARTDAVGHCRIDHVENEELTVSIHAPTKSGRPDPIPAHWVRGIAPTSEPIRVQLPSLPQGSLFGQVSGGALSRDRLILRRDDWRRGGSPSRNGAFSFSGLAAGRYYITINRSGAAHEFGPFELRAAIPMDVGLLEIPGHDSLEIHVSNSVTGGAPPKWIRLSRIGGDASSLKCLGHDGRYAPPPAAPGSYFVFAAEAEGAVFAQISVGPETERIKNVPLQTSTPLTVKISSANPLNGSIAQVDVFAPTTGGTEVLVGSTRVQGEFVHQDPHRLSVTLPMPRGEFTLEFTVMGRRPPRASVTIGNTPPAPLQLRID